jgi:NTP pyrophosphatase (non-canonical NTP hydrolase)
MSGLEIKNESAASMNNWSSSCGNSWIDELNKKTLYSWAWNHWGAEAQIDMLIEEMSELTQALLKSRRNGVIFSNAVFEEIADVEICLEQIKQKIEEIALTGSVEDIKEKKLERLKNRLIADATEKEGVADTIMGLCR